MCMHARVRSQSERVQETIFVLTVIGKRFVLIQNLFSVDRADGLMNLFMPLSLYVVSSEFYVETMYSISDTHFFSSKPMVERFA